MTSYAITFSRSGRSARGAPVLWFVPMSGDMFPKREVSLIEATSARDAVTAFMTREGVDADPDAPARGSPLLHGWFLSGKTTAGDYIDSFVTGGRRSLSFKTPTNVRFRILSVEEQIEPVPGDAIAAGRQ